MYFPINLTPCLSFGVISFILSLSSTVSSYSFDYVTDKKMGLKLSLKGEKEEMKFVAPKMRERENEFQKALGWA